MRKLPVFAKYAWGVVAYNLLVILWGAYVRATGSGAGCGSHWPLCNGVVIPSAPEIQTVIEFTHRLSSGVALLLVVILILWAYRRYPTGHPVRLGATFSMVFIITEALVGAGLVLFGWVANDASSGRAISIAVHLVNTFLLLAALSLTAWWASGGKSVDLKRNRVALWGFLVAFLGVVLIGTTGAITALGDTLFPMDSLAEGIEQDFSATAHFLIRLRVWHPVIAILVGLYIIFLSVLMGLFREDKTSKNFAITLSGLFVVQLVAGLVNLVLLAPIWMQIVHLFLADLVWITLVLFFAATFSAAEEKELKEIAREKRGAGGIGRGSVPATTRE